MFLSGLNLGFKHHPITFKSPYFLKGMVIYMSAEELGRLLVKIGDGIALNFKQLHEELKRIENLLKIMVAKA